MRLEWPASRSSAAWHCRGPLGFFGPMAPDFVEFFARAVFFFVTMAFIAFIAFAMIFEKREVVRVIKSER